MKKLTTIALLFTMIGSMFLLSACGEEEEDLSSKIEEKVIAYQTDLEDSASTLTSTEAIRDYLCNWAKSKGIKYTVDSLDNVIMSVNASKEYKEADPTVIVCSYDAKQFENGIEPMAMALYIAKNNESTGKLDVIFTSETGHDYAGIKSLDNKYFKDNTNVFCLGGGQKNMWSTNTGARSSYTFSNNVAYTAPTGDKAYKVKISGLPGGIPDSKISSYPNPIKELGDLLAYFKTNALIYELADITGGSSGNLYPKSASMTIVIDEDDVDKFDSRMETAMENFNDDYLEDYPDVTYTYEEVDLPEKVVTEEYQNEFVSMLYTLLDGVYYKDDDENLISITSIGSIHSKDGSYTISAVGNSLSQSNMSEIDNTYKTICGLSDIKYKKYDEQPGFQSDMDSKFAEEVAAAFKEYSDADIEFKDCVPATNASYVYEKNKKSKIINVSVNEDKTERYTGTIITFMMNQTHTEVTD